MSNVRKETLDKILPLFRAISHGAGNIQLPDSRAVVVLSAPPLQSEPDLMRREVHPEQTARILAGIRACEVIAQRLNINEAGQLPLLVLSGDTQQLGPMLTRSLEFGFLIDRIRIVDCGSREVANTRTQFETINQWLINAGLGLDSKPIVFVTSPYHMPRVALTAEVNFLTGANYVVIGADFAPQLSTGISGKSWSEMNRIERYYKKGDCAREVKRGRLIFGDWS